MAFYNQNNDYKVSEFNSAALKMIRLNKIQDTLNQINGNLLMFNINFGVYNYVLKIRMIESLLQEVESKLDDEERKEVTQAQNVINEFMEMYPIMQKGKQGYFSSNQLTPHPENWKKLQTLLFKYESLVRKLIDHHGMDTKYGEDDYGL